jgi:hypothetical protein
MFGEFGIVSLPLGRLLMILFNLGCCPTEVIENLSIKKV